jgi:hypothetical protein
VKLREPWVIIRNNKGSSSFLLDLHPTIQYDWRHESAPSSVNLKYERHEKEVEFGSILDTLGSLDCH